MDKETRFKMLYMLIDEYVEDYILYGENNLGQDGTYTPSENERALILDAIHGLIADDEFLSLLCSKTD